MPLAISLEACLKSLQGKLNPEESDRVSDVRLIVAKRTIEIGPLSLFLVLFPKVNNFYIYSFSIIIFVKIV